MTVRRATPDDAGDAARVFTAAFASMNFVPKMHSAEEDRAFVRSLILEKDVWVAERDARVIGLACWHDGWLEQLYVDPAHHDGGAGTALLARVMREHPEGFQLWTFQANAGARRFYERHGFRAVEFTDGSRNEERQPDVRYVWRPAHEPGGTWTTTLVACTDAHFAWMLGGEAPSPELRLPPGGIDAAPVLEMLRSLTADIGRTHPACAWLMTGGDEVVGLCSLIRTADAEGVATIGYGVAESRRRRGHATRAIGLMVGEVLRDPKVRGVGAETSVTNLPSQRVLEENGFVKVGKRIDDDDGEVFVWSFRGGAAK